MDLPNRMAIEGDFQAEMEKLHAKQERELVNLMGNPPSMANVPETYWQKNKREIEALLLLFLAGVFATSANAHGAKRAHLKSNQWVQSRAAQVAEQHVRKTRETLRQQQQEWQAQESPNQQRRSARDSVRTQFEPSRAENVAASETTAATSAGAETGVRERDAVSQSDRWRTEEDGRVCPVCSPLNGSTRRRWSRFFPSGPPAHPRCRCWIDYVNEEPEPEEPMQPGPEAPGQPTREKISLGEVEIPFWKKNPDGGYTKQGMREESREHWKKNLKSKSDAEKKPRIRHIEGEGWDLTDGRHRLEAQMNEGSKTVVADAEYRDAAGELLRVEEVEVRIK